MVSTGNGVRCKVFNAIGDNLTEESQFSYEVVGGSGRVKFSLSSNGYTCTIKADGDGIYKVIVSYCSISGRCSETYFLLCGNQFAMEAINDNAGVLPAGTLLVGATPDSASDPIISILM